MSKRHDPFWTIRGVYEGQDVCLVVEGETQTAAECFATKRGVDVVFVTEADRDEIIEAKTTGMLWRYSPETKLKCFGRPVSKLQALCFVALGVATIVVNLRVLNIPIPLPTIKLQF